MIDVMKRLAELDSTNPNVVKENAVAECGPMGIMGGMAEDKPDTPASINMTAGSGDELANMLATIMQLAGVKQVGADDLGVEHEPAVITAEPAMGVSPAVGDRDDMRSVLDKLNPMDGDDESDEEGDNELGAFQQDNGDEESDDKEETDEGEYDNSPASAEPKKPFNSNEFANQENQPGQGDRMDGNMPKATMEQTLMAAYKQFVGE